MKDPDIHDCGKLIRVLKFLSKTIGDNSVIGADKLYEVLTYVDSSYATHDGMGGHNGGFMTLSKQKLNTKISTDSKVFEAINYIPFSIWLAMYMEHQGYKAKINQIMQDNKSAMKMENNGQNLCTGNE